MRVHVVGGLGCISFWLKEGQGVGFRAFGLGLGVSIASISVYRHYIPQYRRITG